MLTSIPRLIWKSEETLRQCHFSMQSEKFLRFQVLDEHNASSFLICFELNCFNSCTKIRKNRNNKHLDNKLPQSVRSFTAFICNGNTNKTSKIYITKNIDNNEHHQF